MTLIAPRRGKTRLTALLVESSWTATLVALFTLAASCSRPPAGPSDPPPSPAVENVLLVTVDTLRFDAVGFAGNEASLTPVLDRLAATGRNFAHAHAHSVMTLPSHTSILTGLYPYQHQVRDNAGFRLGDKIPTLATELRAAGFATAAFVAAYPLDSRFGLDRGFGLYDDAYNARGRDQVFVHSERSGSEVVKAARKWWLEYDGQRRFLWVHLFEPHAPYQPPEPFASRFEDNPYLGEVAAVDTYLAPLLEPFIAGQEPPTLIILTADHGESLGEHGEATHGLFAYDSTLRVPLVVWGPGVTPGRDSQAARHVDLVPTILDTLRLDVSAGLPGRSLFSEPTDPTEGESYFESLSTNFTLGWAPLRGVIKDGMKYIDLPVPELYDLQSDPGEERNLLEDDRRTAQRLRALIPSESVWPPAADEIPPEECGQQRPGRIPVR